MSGRGLSEALAPLPDDAQVPVRWVRELLGGAETELVDLTLEQISVETGKAVSTVRGWCASGELRGYKLHGKQWRVPAFALREFFDGQRGVV